MKRDSKLRWEWETGRQFNPTLEDYENKTKSGQTSLIGFTNAWNFASHSIGYESGPAVATRE